MEMLINVIWVKKNLIALRAAQMATKQTPRYDGTWRPEDGKVLPEIPAGVEPVIRIKSSTGTIEFDDGVKVYEIWC